VELTEGTMSEAILSNRGYPGVVPTNVHRLAG
jgi:hypothetical protein